MVCTTVRKGRECPFMTAKGCSYNGGICHELVEQCNGCSRSQEFASAWYCTTYPDPALKWRNGVCNLATHVTKAGEDAKKAKLNPIKASKRGRR